MQKQHNMQTILIKKQQNNTLINKIKALRTKKITIIAKQITKIKSQYHSLKILSSLPPPPANKTAKFVK